MQKKIKSSELLSFLIVEIGGKKKKNKVGTVQLYFLFNPKTAKNEKCTSLEVRIRYRNYRSETSLGY